MAKASKKSAKEASDLFHNIMKASVKDSPRPSIEIAEAEKFYRKGKDYLIVITKKGNTYKGEIYRYEETVNGKDSDDIEAVLIACKQNIDSK